MTRTRFFAVLLISAILLISSACASQIAIGDIAVKSGETVTADIVLDTVPDQGIQGYLIDLEISNPAVASITDVTYPSAFSSLHDNSSFPCTKGYISGMDLTAEYMKGGKTGILFATIRVKGLSGGKAVMRASINRLDGLKGEDLKSDVTIKSPAITVSGEAAPSARPLAVATSGSIPRDINSDGLYEDVDGDGAVTYSDVTLFYYNWHWIEENEPVTLFDFDNNGAIDFGDIIQLNQMRG